MDELLSFIVPIIALVFWLFGLSKSKDEGQNQKRPQRPVQQKTSHTQQPRTETTIDQTIPDLQTIDTNPESEQETFAQQKEKQMEKLKEKIQHAENIRDKSKDQQLGKHDAIKDGPPPRAYRKDSKEQISLSVEKNLTSKGIAQGIIMSEVLGPPRAYQKRKHYRNYR
ncbi:hypothetical protein [Gracilibacillus thailandensis]|uniref:Uncharacterized protein n=1 Tax=Gracilibacillus thailandensis TaxID=563735 RepID=A0A6N7R560_9BACI|nr:hypothetical protein [Gracilibacillus thailandensis]MRI68280.1 hypothetical protein [Gracilibacillus thailandensis]